MTVEISIVIVNYNVKAFLQQCLYSVEKACKGIKHEVFVVDNNSVDDSVAMIKQNFEDVYLIENSKNMGFAYACNQAIKKASGKYILLLNPDTVIKEDSLSKCIHFMENHDDAGALGVKMINGKGEFLPESKRSLPTVKSAFYKMFGFSALFPKSKTFGAYQLKYLDKNKIHQVEVLSGAFMLIRKTVLDEIGLLDETFFMYGEDIDLSYRILKAGYKNYYFPNTTIIHYKGESTKKASFKYVRLFYNAMLIFAKKHYKGKKQLFFRLLIRVAVYFRAFLALVKRFFNAIYLPALDFLTIYLSYYIITPFWEKYKFTEANIYPDNFLNLYVPFYILTWLSLVYYFTNYKLKTSFVRLFKAIAYGTIIILTIYSLLPEEYRYSRALIIFGAFLSFFYTSVNRLIIRIISQKNSWSIKKRTILIGHQDNQQISSLSKSLNKHFDILKYIGYKKEDLLNQKTLNKLEEYIRIYKIETLIFFVKDLSTSNIINAILKTADRNLEFKIVMPESSSIVGTNSVIDFEKVPHLAINPISKPVNKIKKRVFDMILTFLFLIISPLFLIKNKAKFFYKTIFEVFIGKRTWVSYSSDNIYDHQSLPAIKPGVFSITSIKIYGQDKVNKMNQNYAQDYRFVKDIIAIFKALKSTINLQKHINN